MRIHPAVLIALVVGAQGCNCKPQVSKVKPALAVTPRSIMFDPVRVGGSDSRTVTLTSGTQAAVTITSAKLANGAEPGGVEAFTVENPPQFVDPMSSTTLTITFKPTIAQAYEVVLTVVSDDPDNPNQKVLIDGTGAQPIIGVTPDCDSTRGCTGTVTVSPPAIDFGAEPLTRPVPTDPSKLPSVNVVNAGPVALDVTGAAFSGVDAAAFSFAGNTSFPDGGVLLDPGAGFNLQIRFVPTSQNQPSYHASLVITSDDPAHPSIPVDLKGTLLPNHPPKLCANLWRVVPPPAVDAPREYGATTDWAPLLVPPAGGYDFTRTRDVRPGDLVELSAQSNLTDPSTCTTDPESGRTGLVYQWTMVSVPAGAEGLGLSGAATPQLQFRPAVTGTYQLSFSVTDPQGAATSTTITLAVAVKQDLVAQVQWLGAAGVDLDVHLVRPSAATTSDPFSGVFEPFEAGGTGKVSGDINGYAVSLQQANPGAGYTFDWGGAGSSDDPKLNLDDKGTTADLLENVSLNYPENDPLCATASCTYKVLVHEFNDARLASSPPACVVDGGVGCRDGDPCDCVSGNRCVANSAPKADAGTATGAGKCYAPPKPVVRIFFHGSPTPAAAIPLDTLTPKDELVMPAPCKMLYVADVVWPAKSAIGSLPDGGTPPPQVVVKGADSTGRVVSPVLGRFGIRQSGGSLQCTSDVTIGGLQWYSQQE
jgi:hypothetical protein